MAKGDYSVGINFQKNKWSTRDAVTFDVNLSVGNPASNESFEQENVVAQQLGKEIEVPTSGNFFARLSQFGAPKGNFPWTVTSDGPNDEVALDVVEAIQLHFMPKVEEEIKRPLVAPTPAAERADRASQQQRNESVWGRHKDALDQAGIRNLQRIDRNAETD
jgi:hypothetical protein